MYKIQYLHLFPFNCNTSTHLFCIESISFLKVLDGISFQYCQMQDFKVSLSSNWHLFLNTLLDKIPYKFSIGFKSGNLVGQSQTSNFFVLNQSFISLEVCMAALSFWKWLYWCLDDSWIGKDIFPTHWYIEQSFVSLPSLSNQPFQMQKKLLPKL